MENLSDYTRLGAVCKPWRTAFVGLPRPLHLRFPLLFLSSRTTINSDNAPDHALYSPFERKVHPVKLPDRPRPERCIGSSSDGWVCMIDDDGLDIYLFNPFSGVVVHLPCLFGDENLFKAVWSAKPTDPDFIIVLFKLDPHSLVYCRTGDAQWTFMHNSLRLADLKCVSDAIFYKEKLYVLEDEEGRIVAVDLLHQEVEEIWIPKLVDSVFPIGFKRMYLAAGPSGLLFIARQKQFSTYEWQGMDVQLQTGGFRIFEFDETMTKWKERESLGDGMLFLGLNASMWLSSSNFQQCKGNSIYFTDDSSYNNTFCYSFEKNKTCLPTLGLDSGVFQLQDRSFDSIIYGHDMKLLYPNTVWVVPNP
ncbi:hypothetical protein QJS10_CPA03g01377 [Acorus calamus]|uniref:KIB1-4 beta-propeller domain-containing protein n=1 Tax=Acorus calamus TaxID=4465 RepID=A0AAV9F6D2_ACOCL|nr:hypothetical protein QJS10_CPA03g01377 [Acorus calamus]